MTIIKLVATVRSVCTGSTMRHLRVAVFSTRLGRPRTSSRAADHTRVSDLCDRIYGVTSLVTRVAVAEMVL
jgi:hypothetical protein